MAMKALRDGASGGITKFFLMGFLVMAVGGLVLMDVGGVFRGGTGSSNVAKIGKETISIVAFDRNLRRTLSRLGMSPQEAHRMGYVEQMLGEEIRTILLRQASEQSGVLVGRERLARHVKQIVAPLVKPGENPQDVLAQILLNQGMSERDFVQSIANDISINLLLSAIKSGFASSTPAITRDLYFFQKETRDIQYMAFMDSELKDIKEPTESQLQILYHSTKEKYALPETRGLKLVKINDKALSETLEISEEEIQQTYDDNIDYYAIEASRTLDQALFDLEENARAVYEKVKDGTSLKDAVKSVTGSTTAYLGEKTFLETQMDEDLSDAVLLAESEGTALEPIETVLGWSVNIVKKITPAHTKSFDEVKDEIRAEITETELSEQIYALANSVDDLLASGASLDDVAQEIDLEITKLPPVTRYGQTPDGKDGLKDYEQSRLTILETAFELEQGETSAVMEMPDGSFIAIHLDTMTPKSYTPFDEVKAEIKKRWLTDQRRLENRMRVGEALSEMTKNSQSLKDYAALKKRKLRTQKALTRSASTENKKAANEKKSPINFTASARANIFEAPLNKPILIDVEGGTAIALVTQYNWPEEDKATITNLDFAQIQSEIVKSMQNEGLQLYLEEKRKSQKISVNKALLDRVYGPESAPY